MHTLLAIALSVSLVPAFLLTGNWLGYHITDRRHRHTWDEQDKALQYPDPARSGPR